VVLIKHVIDTPNGAFEFVEVLIEIAQSIAIAFANMIATLVGLHIITKVMLANFESSEQYLNGYRTGVADMRALMHELNEMRRTARRKSSRKSKKTKVKRRVR